MSHHQKSPFLGDWLSHHGGGFKTSIRNASFLGHARNRMHGARHRVAHDFITVKSLPPNRAHSQMIPLTRQSSCARPGWHEFRLMSIHIILEGNAHHGPKRANRKSIIRMFIDPLKKRLAEYLEFFKTKLVALPEKPLYLIGRQRLRNNWINLISVPISKRMHWLAYGH
jgi:hypothetical protein